MGWLSVLLDEHVPSVFANALVSNDFEATTAQKRYGQESIDRSILDDCADEGLVVITNDRDFVRLADGHDHAGIIMYTDRRVLLDTPLNAVEAVRRIERYYAPEELRNVVEWLDNWC